MQLSHNSLCQHFRSLNSQARASRDHLRFTISYKSSKTLKTADELKQKIWKPYYASDFRSPQRYPVLNITRKF